eukprot:7955038-Pyramimonas_sp.AAC.2
MLYISWSRTLADEEAPAVSKRAPPKKTQVAPKSARRAAQEAFKRRFFGAPACGLPNGEERLLLPGAPSGSPGVLRGVREASSRL